MLNKITFLFLMALPLSVIGQSVAINTDASLAHSSAILDVKSTGKGMLTPRMSTIERTSIMGPAIGLTVFDTDTYSYWMYRGDVNGGWAELQHQFQKLWNASGNDIYNTNPGRVGIGTSSNFDAELKLNGVSPRFAFMHNEVQKGFIRLATDNFKIGTYPGNAGDIIFSPKNVDKVWIDQNGLVGIGTGSPSSELTINGSNPYIQLRNSEVNTGFLMALGSHVKLGTNSTNTTGNLVFQTKLLDRMTIDENGLVGIGTTSPSSILTINSSNPILQLRNNNVDKGFVQLVNDDIKIGTNGTNTNGKFIIRTNGVDRLIVDDNGNALLGSTSSDGYLQMNGPSSSRITFQAGNLTQGHIHATNGELDIYRSVGGNVRLRANGDGIWLFQNGQISMGGGGQRATGYIVSIEGKAIATEFTAMSVGSWPDYVFDKNYQLLPLKDLKHFIARNKHLPNIPAAVEMEKQGIQLGEMSKKLMEKVEELTLYVIQLQDQVDDLKKQLGTVTQKK